MATVPIVTELTLAELNVLVAANELNEGLQYKVTDKDWLLTAISNSTLKPVSGVLRIMNGDNYDNIYPEKIIVDTGLIASDISEERFNLICPVGFYPSNAVFHGITSPIEGLHGNAAVGTFFNSGGDDLLLGVKYKLIATNQFPYQSTITILPVAVSLNTGGGTCRFFVEFTKFF